MGQWEDQENKNGKYRLDRDPGKSRERNRSLVPSQTATKERTYSKKQLAKRGKNEGQG
ncbi:hypothetical protein ACQP3D_27810 [Escherichia coli]